eukprot:3303502-Pleurochrysis_carterae.AAC.1
MAKLKSLPVIKWGRIMLPWVKVKTATLQRKKMRATATKASPTARKLSTKSLQKEKPNFVEESTVREKCDSGVNGVSTTGDGKSEEVEEKEFAHDADDDSGVETSGV